MYSSPPSRLPSELGSSLVKPKMLWWQWCGAVCSLDQWEGFHPCSLTPVMTWRLVVISLIFSRPARYKNSKSRQIPTPPPLIIVEAILTWSRLTRERQWGQLIRDKAILCLKMSSLLLITYHLDIIFSIYDSEYQDYSITTGNHINPRSNYLAYEGWGIRQGLFWVHSTRH